MKDGIAVKDLGKVAEMQAMVEPVASPERYEDISGLEVSDEQSMISLEPVGEVYMQYRRRLDADGKLVTKPTGFCFKTAGLD